MNLRSLVPNRFRIRYDFGFHDLVFIRFRSFRASTRKPPVAQSLSEVALHQLHDRNLNSFWSPLKSNNSQG
ncbi:hypothetical protein L1887_30075 [Cichorium endivia]|nr:hypothetical protein L1887_30075 [Cichorium endivia]